MRNHSNHTSITKCLAVLLLGSLSLVSCKKFLDVGSQVPNALTEDKAFSDSAAATSTVLALYSYLVNSSVTNTTVGFNMVRYPMISADDAYYLTNSAYDNFRNNTLAASNDGSILWSDLYKNIARANYIIRNLNASTVLTESVKNQLLGEAKFWRGWCYFYLTNFYGEVPLVLNTEALETAKYPRSPVTEVYKQIVTDLTEAKAQVQENYVSADRARVNKKSVAAMLARVYFYQQNWPAAETQATEVIGSNTYSILTDLDAVFLKSSNEVILQIAGSAGVTSWGGDFVPASITTPNVVLYDTLGKTFEANDKRKTSWAKSFDYGGKTYYYPNKYKLRAGSTGNEFYVVFRLSEMYLIRAEARANRDNIPDAVDDINEVRSRAGIQLLDETISKADLLNKLEHERWVELFTEWGDRWFNLKRTAKADIVLPLIKPQYKPFQKLYPVPNTELQANPNLLPNNDGY